MGVLFVPSLNEKRLIFVNNINRDEALAVIENFNQRVLASRKVKTAVNATSELYKEYQFFDTEAKPDFSAGLTEFLAQSSVPQTRGLRCSFVDKNGIVVGTTVVYNQNWATVGFVDETIPETIVNSLDVENNESEEEEEDDTLWEEEEYIFGANCHEGSAVDETKTADSKESPKVEVDLLAEAEQVLEQFSKKWEEVSTKAVTKTIEVGEEFISNLKKLLNSSK